MMTSKVSQIATIFQQGHATNRDGGHRDNLGGSHLLNRFKSHSREDILRCREVTLRDRSASTDCMLPMDSDRYNRKGSADSRDSLLSRERSSSREEILSQTSSKDILLSRESLLSSRDSLSSSSGRQKEVSVVRSESHLARFNNARAMFEKMSSVEKIDCVGAAPLTPDLIKSPSRKVAMLTPLKKKESNGPLVQKTPLSHSKSVPDNSSIPLSPDALNKVNLVKSAPSIAQNNPKVTCFDDKFLFDRPNSFTANFSNKTENRKNESNENSAVQNNNNPLSPQHQQHKELVQRHKNWFQSYSKNKAVTSPPSDWRKERFAILSGRGNTPKVAVVAPKQILTPKQLEENRMMKQSSLDQHQSPTVNSLKRNLFGINSASVDFTSDTSANQAKQFISHKSLDYSSYTDAFKKDAHYEVNTSTDESSITSSVDDSRSEILYRHPFESFSPPAMSPVSEEEHSVCSLESNCKSSTLGEIKEESDQKLSVQITVDIANEDSISSDCEDDLAYMKDAERASAKYEAEFKEEKRYSNSLDEEIRRKKEAIKAAEMKAKQREQERLEEQQNRLFQKKLEEEQRIKEQQSKQEEIRIQKLEQDRKNEEQRRLEEQRIEEEKLEELRRINEQERLEKERQMEKNRLEEKRMIEEAQRREEEKRLMEEQKIEEERMREEVRRVEEERRQEEARRVEEERRREEARRVEEERRREEARRVEEERRREEARRVEEERRREEARRVEEERRREEARRVEEERRREEARKVEEERMYEEAHRMEEERRREEARIVEEERKQEEALRLEEEKRQEEAQRLEEERRREEARRVEEERRLLEEQMLEKERILEEQRLEEERKLEEQILEEERRLEENRNREEERRIEAEKRIIDEMRIEGSYEELANISRLGNIEGIMADEQKTDRRNKYKMAAESIVEEVMDKATDIVKDLNRKPEIEDTEVDLGFKREEPNYVEEVLKLKGEEPHYVEEVLKLKGEELMKKEQELRQHQEKLQQEEEKLRRLLELEGKFDDSDCIREEVEDVDYDTTVHSAQHIILMCGSSPYISRQRSSSPNSRDEEPSPLPPPIPPHSVDPASIPSSDFTYDLEEQEEGEESMSSSVIIREDAGQLLSDNEAREVRDLLSQDLLPDNKLPPPSYHESINTDEDVPSYPPPMYSSVEGGDKSSGFSAKSQCDYNPTTTIEVLEDRDLEAVNRVPEIGEEDGVHYLEDGHFWVEVPGLDEYTDEFDDELQEFYYDIATAKESDNDDDNSSASNKSVSLKSTDDQSSSNSFLEHFMRRQCKQGIPFHKPTKIKFSSGPIQVFSTHSVTEYDRRNDAVDPVAASAVYELEKRVDKMDVFPVTVHKGSGGLGLSIIGMGVGADAGMEKLGIFVKTITPNGATDRAHKIQVNDQIVEVDGQSLVGVTQVFAASVLKNTNGEVHVLVGREKDPENSEVAMLIRQSLAADEERKEMSPEASSPEDLTTTEQDTSQCDTLASQASQMQHYSVNDSSVKGPAEEHELQSVLYKCSLYEGEVKTLKEKIVSLETELTARKLEESLNASSASSLQSLQEELSRSREKEEKLDKVVEEAEEKIKEKESQCSNYQDMLEQSQGQYIILEKKYYKAKKIIKEYQSREKDFLHREEYHVTQLQEKDSHYNALLKALKDKVIELEGELSSLGKAPLSPHLSAADDSSPPHTSSTPPPLPTKHLPSSPTPSGDDLLLSDTEASKAGLRSSEESLDDCVPPHSLLDVSAGKAKANLANKGGLANRSLPSAVRRASIDSSLEESAVMSSNHKQTSADLNKQTSLDVSALSKHAPFDVSSLNKQTPPVARVLPVNRDHQADGKETLAQQLKTILAQRGAEASPVQPPPPVRTPASLMEDVRQAVMEADVQLGKKPLISGPLHVSSTSQMILDADQQIQIQESSTSIAIGTNTDSESWTIQNVFRSSSGREANTANTTTSVLSGWSPFQSLRSVVTGGSSSLVASAVAPMTPPATTGGVVLLNKRHIDVGESVVPVSEAATAAAAPPKSFSTLPKQHGSIIHDPLNYHPNQRHLQQHYNPHTQSLHRKQTAAQVAHPPQQPLPHSQSHQQVLSQPPMESVRQTPAPGVVYHPPLAKRSAPPPPASHVGGATHGGGAYVSCHSVQSVDWNVDQVTEWLVINGLGSCVQSFALSAVNGIRLLNIDAKDLKNLVENVDDRNKIKKKVKELRTQVEKEKKQLEKEKKEKERLMKKAEKLAEKAEKRKK